MKEFKRKILDLIDTGLFDSEDELQSFLSYIDSRAKVKAWIEKDKEVKDNGSN